MSKKVLLGLGVVGIIVIAFGAAYVLRPTAEVSAPLEAEPVVAESEREGMDEEKSAEDMGAHADVAADGLVVMVIHPEESEVRFTMGELLGGVPTTVVGVTDQVVGEIAIDPENPAESKIGVIKINARTFATDSNFRNRAINNEILETDEFEFVTFTPTAVTGFPENPAIGELLEFQITGDLMIRDITQEITFDAAVTMVSENRMEGYAAAMVARDDYGLDIPEVPRVADVDEEVLVEIEFAAERK